METSANARIYVPDRGNTTCCNEIIAFNPQYYTTPQMVCDAADRARGLINAEGLHLIEHILLRPHCTDGDCKCIIQPCGYQADCEFEWDMPKDDPCTRDEKICFIPGADPYSFTATVILPVWPERFRNKGNRQIMENMLYREAPAHVMLRVLWLTPEDLCRFEYLYRNWRKWLANKMVCNEPDPACRLIEFLFERRSRENREPRKFYCFEGEDCIPCADQTTADDICAGTKETEKDPNEYVNTINALYCWPYICPPGRLVQQMETLTKENVPADAESPVMVDPAEKEREIIKRFNQYENKIRAIVKKTGNLHAEQAASFLSKYTTDFAPYHDVVYSILVNKKTEGAKRILTASEKHILIENITWHYLDMLLLKNAFDKHSTELKNLMKMLGEKGLKPDFENWDGRGLQQYEQQINSGQIKKIFK